MASRIYRSVTICVVLLLMILDVCINNSLYAAAHSAAELKSELYQKNKKYDRLLADGIIVDQELDILGEGIRPSIVEVTESEEGTNIMGSSDLSFGKSPYVVPLHFINGCTVTQAEIAYRVNKNKIANNWKSTRTVMNNYSDSEYHQYDNLTSIQAMTNRFDWNVLNNKENRGVMMFECFEGKESNHQINHNYFGLRTYLGVNVGYISIKC